VDGVTKASLWALSVPVLQIGVFLAEILDDIYRETVQPQASFTALSQSFWLI
jgi:hypothetical protein